MSTTLIQDARRAISRRKHLNDYFYYNWLIEAYKAPEREELLDYAEDNLLPALDCGSGYFRVDDPKCFEILEKYGFRSSLWRSIFSCRQNTFNSRTLWPKFLDLTEGMILKTPKVGIYLKSDSYERDYL